MMVSVGDTALLREVDAIVKSEMSDELLSEQRSHKFKCPSKRIEKYGYGRTKLVNLGDLRAQLRS
jgi:hypothetical protein